MEIDDNFIRLCQHVLADRLEQLSEAALLLLQQTTPETPMPRPRIFPLTQTRLWPHDGNLRSIGSTTLVPGTPYPAGSSFSTLDARHNAARSLLQECRGQPARIMKIVEQLDAATQWCKDRTAGRKRAAEEIVRQQGRAVSRLLPIVVAKKLKGSGEAKRP